MIHVTEKAAGEIRRLLSKETAENQFLRVQVVGGGCSGMSYKLGFEAGKRDNDKFFEEQGVKVIVDPKSYLYIAGMTLDFLMAFKAQALISSIPTLRKAAVVAAPSRPDFLRRLS